MINNQTGLNIQVNITGPSDGIDWLLLAHQLSRARHPDLCKYWVAGLPADFAGGVKNKDSKLFQI